MISCWQFANRGFILIVRRLFDVLVPADIILKFYNSGYNKVILRQVCVRESAFFIRINEEIKMIIGNAEHLSAYKAQLSEELYDCLEKMAAYAMGLKACLTGNMRLTVIRWG